MKVALVTGGQSRFTPEFLLLLNQLKGFNSADIYMTFWKSDWAQEDHEARIKVEKILPTQYNLAKIKIIDEPFHRTPPCPIDLDPPKPENIQWWYQRIASQLTSLSMTYDLLDQKYDAVIRFRVDGMLDRDIDLRNLGLSDNEIIVPTNPKSGEGPYPSDQFAIGTQDSMKVYFSLGKVFQILIPEADPTWWVFKTYPNQSSLHRGPWGPESLLNLLYIKNNIKYRYGDFNHTFNTFGRSKYTDKHYHHKIAVDPTDAGNQRT